ncbi:MAG: hypothetical protein RLZZ592_128 [Pseudomonadota bacterium]|jgi:uncharacterized protein YbaP (TraB family)
MTAHRAGRMVRRWLAAGLLAALLPVLGQAQPVSAPDCPAAPELPAADRWLAALPGPVDRGLLWRLEKGRQVSYLYGTIHIARRDWIDPGPTVLAALQAADRVAFELDLLDPAVLARLQQAAREPASALALPAPLAERLARQRTQACAGDGLQALRPELQVATLASLSLRDEGLDPAWGIDGWLALLAHARRQTVVSLETPEQQVALLAQERPAARAQAVQRGLDELEDPAARRVALRLAASWAEADRASLENFAAWCHCLDRAAEREAHRRGVTARNPAMAERIAAMHRQGARVFAAVGVLHLVGPQGLPSLLARRGFRVVPLVPAPRGGVTSP